MEDYKILEKINSGSFGDVYKITRDDLDNVKAVKKFKKVYKSKEEAEEEIEVQFFRKVHHPGII